MSPKPTIARTPDARFVAIRDRIEHVLPQYGFSLAFEAYHPEAFGSAVTEYRGRGQRLRLVWDGKDGLACLTVAEQRTNAFPQPDAYRDLEARAEGTGNPATAITSVALAESRAEVLCERLVACLELLRRK